MDQLWSREYKPTAKLTPTSSLLGFPDSTKLPDLEDNLIAATQNLKATPHDGSLWLKRARLLQSLGFPDLAVGDAHKALLLVEVDHDSDHTDEKPGSIENVDADDVFKCLIDCLIDANAHKDARDVYKEWKTQPTGNRTDEEEALCRRIFTGIVTMEKRVPKEYPGRDALLSIGHVLVRDWPWMGTEQINRSSKLMKRVAFEITKSSKEYATLRSSTVRGTTTNVWGVFATKDIPKDHLIFADPATITAVDPDTPLPPGVIFRCQTCAAPVPRPKGVKGFCNICSYCSSECYEKGQQTFHAISCPADYPTFPLTINPGVPATRLTRLDLYARYLSTLAIEAAPKEAEDPIRRRLIARLTQNAGGPETHAFSYFDHIEYPIALLQDLGVDVFSDHRWDTHVLLNIRRRIDNNNHGRMIHAVHQNMAMLNHSCEPNVELNEGEDGGDEDGKAVLHMRAARDIKEGEELTIRYTGDEGDELAARRYALMHWLGRDCQCGRCLREEAEQALEGMSIG